MVAHAGSGRPRLLPAVFGCSVLLVLLGVEYLDMDTEWTAPRPSSIRLGNGNGSEPRSTSSPVATDVANIPHVSKKTLEGSRCEEIFNIGAGGPLGNVSESLLKRIMEAKSGGDPWDFDLDAYDQLSSSMPSLLPPRGENGSSGFLVGVPGEAKSVRVPWLPCRLHLYHPLEVKRCFLRRRRKKLSNCIIFVGDSKTRRTFQAMGRLLQEMNVMYHLYDGTLVNWTAYNVEDMKKSHDNQFLTSSIVPDLQFYLFFVSNLAKSQLIRGDDRGAREIFTALINLPTGKHPAFVVINVGAWLLAHSEGESLKGIDDFYIDLQATTDLIRDLAKKLTVVLWLSDPYKTPDGARYTESNDKLEWITKNLLWKLSDSDVILWDSTLPVAWAYQRDCRVVEEDPEGYDHLYGTQDWLCYDFIHLGFVPLAFRAQVLVNYLCNGVEGREGVCCT